MSTCIIITGWDPSNRIPTSVISTASDPTCGYGGTLICGCELCVNSCVGVFPEAPTGTFAVGFLVNKELLPAETYVLTFTGDEGAQAWLQSAAPALSGKTVYKIHPAN
jgi:hypothetical protein